MLIIRRPHTNPYFNIAAEEYILKTFSDDIFMLWQNEPSIIVGKHQNTLAEINYEFVKRNSIPVVRRISGGGTVFHDLGNLNFSFIRKGEKGKLVDFKRFTTPIVEVLNDIGVPARFEGKNDLRVNGLKISGNAEHVYKNRVLHHGTLLFSSDLTFLNKAIKVKEGRFTDKAVKSNRSKVINILDLLPLPVTIEEFKDKITGFIVETEKDAAFYNLSEKDISGIEKLAEDKYSRWSWNFGYSPKYTLNNTVEVESGKVEITVEVHNGIIKNLTISGYGIDVETSNNLKEILVGVSHNESSVEDALNGFQNRDNSGLTAEKLLAGLF